MAGQAKVLPPIIQDEMQKRRMMKRATTVAKFQTRIFVLYKHQLVYKTKDGKQVVMILSELIRSFKSMVRQRFSNSAKLLF